ncbi:MAG: hypothetical protein ACYTE8_07135, partial [Planctomycetota bacterium]
MVKSKEKRNALPVLLVCVMGVFLYTSVALSEQADTSSNLHPQGLDSAGVYSLRGIDPNLTGEGVKLFLLSRSLTYSNEEPQNDYQPLIEHPCFDKENITFQDDGRIEAGISTHSTAICSILLGDDPNAFDEQIGEIVYQGAVPEAKLEVTEFQYFLTNHVFKQIPIEADILISAMGGQFEDWWTRGIDSMAEQYGL